MKTTLHYSTSWIPPITQRTARMGTFVMTLLRKISLQKENTTFCYPQVSLNSSCTTLFASEVVLDGCDLALLIGVESICGHWFAPYTIQHQTTPNRINVYAISALQYMKTLYLSVLAEYDQHAQQMLVMATLSISTI